MKQYIKYLILGLSMILLPAMDANGKGSSSSRSSSSSSFSSSRSSTPSKPSAVKPSSSGFSSSSSKPNSNGSVTSKPKSAFEISQQRKALTPPPPKDKFVSDFKQKNASKYPTTFNTPPSIRPNYIPPSTNYNGRNRDVQYNPATRSYGFFDDFGKFMVYDAITDIALGAFQKEEKVYIQTSEQLKKDEETAAQRENESEEFWNKILITASVFIGMIALIIFGVILFDLFD